MIHFFFYNEFTYEWGRRGVDKKRGATRKGKVLALFLLLKNVNSVGIDCYVVKIKKIGSGKKKNKNKNKKQKKQKKKQKKKNKTEK